VEYC